MIKPKLWIKVTSSEDQDENTVPASSAGRESDKFGGNGGGKMETSGSMSIHPNNSNTGCSLTPKTPTSGATTPSASPVSPGYLQRKRRSSTLSE
ncbi:unnamed protein product, partial [Allacma fusca]